MATEPPASEAPDHGGAPASVQRPSAAAEPLLLPRTEPRPAAGTGPTVLPGFALESPGPPPSKAARRAPRRAARESSEPPAAQRYAESYAQGQTDATGAPFAVPTQKSVFWPILKAYALDARGQPLTDDAALAWIRDSSAEYRRAKAGQEHFEKGFPPPKWAEWLQAGKPRSGAGTRRGPQFQGGRTDPDERAAHQRKRAAELALHLEQDSI